MALHKLRRRHVIAAAASVVALAVPAGASAASAAAGSAGTAARPPRTPHVGAACTTWERLSTLAVEQRRVLKLFKGFEVLRNQADMDRLAKVNPQYGTHYALLSHMYNSMKGIGLTIVNDGAQGPGKPTLVFYKPDPRVKDPTHAFEPNFPYRLVGWGYVSPYTPGKAPSFPGEPGLRCLKPKDSFIHERSVHPADTWFNTRVPPKNEAWKGEDPGATWPTAEECDCQVGMSHGRFWDSHLFLTGTPFPWVSMFNPGRPIPGFDAVVGQGFFFPERPAS
ncbi:MULTISPECIES: hypothetical protein [Actinomadura]|uniref:hypothetical protein n=1 Tax=Actinomadura TaxID=1988 RepID=UPI001BE4B3B4|nr:MULTISPECIES: hypothetical protein [Actinomadura]MBT2212804.1 hypothetical protein [Actinomadura sp. NEAU-AAG7]